VYFYELVSRVCENLDRNDLSGTSLAALSATKAGHWINDTRQSIATKYKFSYYYWEATLNTVAGSAYYPLPSDYLDHFTVFVGDTKLSRYSMQNFDENISSAASSEIASNTGSGQPQFYVLRGMQFQLYPTPDNAYEINLRYYAKPEVFTASADYDHVSNLYPDTVQFGATYRGAMWAEDSTNIERYKELFIASLQEMITNEKEKELGDAHYRLKTWRDFQIGTFGNQMRINYDGRTDRTRRSNYLNSG